MNALLTAGSRPGSQSAAVVSAAEHRLEPAAAPPPPAGEVVCPLPYAAPAPTAGAADAARPSAFLDALRLAGGAAAETAPIADAAAGPTDSETVEAAEGEAADAALLGMALLDASAERARAGVVAARRDSGEAEEKTASTTADAALLGPTPTPGLAPLVAAPAGAAQDTGSARGRGSAQADSVGAAVAALADASARTGVSADTLRAPGSPAAVVHVPGDAVVRAPAHGGVDSPAGERAAQAAGGAGAAAATAPLPPVAEAAAVASPAPSETADPSLRLPNGTPAGWRQPLADALGDRLQLQLGRGSERAVIRLDPPMMGSVEIVVRHEAGSVQVQLTATHGEVLRQLHAIADGLRQDLVGRQYADVGVHVADGSRDAGGRQRQGSGNGEDADGAPGRSLAEDGSDESTTFTLA